MNPYGPPGPPPMPGGPPPMPGMPPPPRPPGGGPLVPLLIIGAVVMLVIIGLGGFVVFSGDDDDDDPVRTLPTPISTPTGLDTDGPTPDTTTGGGNDPSGVLDTSIETAQGNTFRQVGTRTDSCTSRANSTLLTRLRTYPCTDQLHSAVYANSSRMIVTVVSIMEVSTSSAATSVSNATYSKGWPKLLKAATSSGLPQLSKEPPYWTRTWTLGNQVIYAQSYWARGGAVGGRTGSVYRTAGELGTEVTNALRFAN